VRGVRCSCGGRHPCPRTVEAAHRQVRSGSPMTRPAATPCPNGDDERCQSSYLMNAWNSCPGCLAGRFRRARPNRAWRAAADAPIPRPVRPAGGRRTSTRLEDPIVCTCQAAARCAFKFRHHTSDPRGGHPSHTQHRLHHGDGAAQQYAAGEPRPAPASPSPRPTTSTLTWGTWRGASHLPRTAPPRHASHMWGAEHPGADIAESRVTRIRRPTADSLLIGDNRICRGQQYSATTSIFPTMFLLRSSRSSAST
jgi:hypothetical protein